MKESWFCMDIKSAFAKLLSEQELLLMGGFDLIVIGTLC